MIAFQKPFLLGFAGGLIAAVCHLGFALAFGSERSTESHAVTNERMLSAVARFGEQRSGRSRNTFYFPTNTNLGDEMVVYWREENILFSFPADVSDAAVESPSLVVNRVWTLDESSFRHSDDPEMRTSTYMESWPTAVKWMRAAVVEGRMLVLEYERDSANNPIHP